MRINSTAVFEDDFQEELQRQQIEQEIIKKNDLRKELTKKRTLIKKAYIRRILFVSILCSFSIILMCGYVNITNEREKLAQLQKELKTQVDISKELELEIDGKYTLSEIERIATQKYSMAHPDNSQIVYVAVKDYKPTQNVALDTKKKSNYNNREFSIINFIKKLF